MATFSQYFSLDKGFTWDWCSKFRISEQRFQEFATVSVNNLVKIKLKENIEPFDENSAPWSGYVLKSDIQVFKNGTSKILQVPFDNQINNVHVDKSGKLYVSVGRGIHDKKTGKYLSAEKSQSAIIYISKKNVQQLID